MLSASLRETAKQNQNKTNKTKKHQQQPIEPIEVNDGSIKWELFFTRRWNQPHSTISICTCYTTKKKNKKLFLASGEGTFSWQRQNASQSERWLFLDKWGNLMNSLLHRRLWYTLEHLLQLTSYHIAVMKNSLLFWNPLAARVNHWGPKAHLSFVRTEAKWTPSCPAAEERGKKHSASKNNQRSMQELRRRVTYGR